MASPRNEPRPNTQRSSDTSIIGRKNSEDVEKDIGTASDQSEDADVERQPQNEASEKKEEDERDPNIVDWDGPDDRQVRKET